MTTTLLRACGLKRRRKDPPTQPQTSPADEGDAGLPLRILPVLYTVNRNHASWTRDGFAHSTVTSTFMRAGIPADMPIVLMPEDTDVLKAALEELKNESDKLEEIGCQDDWPSIELSCLLTLVGRPPSHHDAEGRKKHYFSRTWLEARILDGMSQVFAKCSRQCIALQPEFARQLRPEHTHAAELYYKFYDTAADGRSDHYDFMAVPRESLPTGALRKVKLRYDVEQTYGYIAYVPAIPVLDCPALAVFGLSGDDTQRLAYSLGPEGELPHLLKDIVTGPAGSSRLVIVEMKRTGPRAFVNGSNPINKNFTAQIVLDASSP